jgi:hypothetical protein
MSSILNSPQEPRPWWRFGMVWMVLGGPVVVVVASLTTFYIAASHPDPVITETPRMAMQKRQGITHAPAMQARNHSATGELPKTKDVPGKADSGLAEATVTMPSKP